MAWKKLGRIFIPDGQTELMRSHAQNPQAIHLNGSEMRIFFASRDLKNRSSIFSLDIDVSQSTKVLRISSSPVLSFGSPGYFDDSGVTHGHLMKYQGQHWLYYLGWNLGVTVPWRNSIGLAKSDSLDGPYKKVFSAPILDRSHDDPFSLSYPYVIPGNEEWTMLYGSNLAWGHSKEDMHHVIKEAKSSDGLIWKSTGKIILEIDEAKEIAVSRPWLAEIDGKRKLFFSYRKDTYRIGSAELNSENRWVRTCDDEILPTAGEWDGEMVCYPSLFQFNNENYLLYCGNGYGKTGFGIAIWKPSSS